MPTIAGNEIIGSGYRDLLESGFKVGENSRMPKKSPVKFWQKIKTTFLKHDYFPLLKLKMWCFVQECAAELPLLSSAKIIFQKFSFFWHILSPIWLCTILCAPTVLTLIRAAINWMAAICIKCLLYGSRYSHQPPRIGRGIARTCDVADWPNFRLLKQKKCEKLKKIPFQNYFKNCFHFVCVFLLFKYSIHF